MPIVGVVVSLLLGEIVGLSAGGIIVPPAGGGQWAEFQLQGVKSNRAGIGAQLRFTVGGSDKAKDLFGLFDDTIQTLLSAAK